ncbi:MAG: YpmA family protein [Eubacteriales bacterium]
MDEQNREKLEIIASKTFKQYDEMYKVVDYLNKTLKHKNVMFGLTRNQENGSMTITIYEI